MEGVRLDEVALYDLTRDRLRQSLSNQFPADFDLENAITAYAYWVCTVMRNHGKDWQTALQEYIDVALRDAVLESQAEQIELELLCNELRQFSGPLLDVGAGWGRYGSLYRECGLQVVYAEPSSLGCRLLRRNAPCSPVRCLGQALSFPTAAFNGAVIGWVLHHDAPDVPAAAILREVARAIASSGRLLSVEPLSDDFDKQKWCKLVESAGFEVEKVVEFFEFSDSPKEGERYAFLVAVRHSGR
jgi:SAM-dependent methyltransferase